MSPVIKKTAVPIIFSTNLLKILLFKNKKQKKALQQITKGLEFTGSPGRPIDSTFKITFILKI